MIDRFFELAKDPDCIFALFSDGGGRFLSSFRPDDARLFYPTGRVNTNQTSYPEIRKLKNSSNNFVSIYTQGLQVSEDGYFYNASTTQTSYIRFLGYNFLNDVKPKTFMARVYLPKISYSGSESNYYYTRPFRIGTSSMLYTIEINMASPATDNTFQIKGRWNSYLIKSSVGFEQGQWVTVVLTKQTLDSGQVYCELWINGAVCGTLTLPASSDQMKTTDRIETAYLGLSRSSDPFKYDFSMIFDRVLSNEEIIKYSNQPKTEFTSPAVEGTWDELFSNSSPKYIGNLPSGSLIKVVPSNGGTRTLPDVKLQTGVSLKLDLTSYNTVTIGLGVDLEQTEETGIYKTTSEYMYYRILNETLDTVTIQAS